jgi:hypothetical protein
LLVNFIQIYHSLKAHEMINEFIKSSEQH